MIPTIARARVMLTTVRRAHVSSTRGKFVAIDLLPWRGSCGLHGEGRLTDDCRGFRTLKLKCLSLIGLALPIQIR